MKHQEHIVCIPAKLVNKPKSLIPFTTPKSDCWVNYKLETKDIITVQRAVAETTEDFRQVLPLVVFKYKDSVWTYRRTPKGGEGALHGQLSIAVGGHFDATDLQTDGGVIDPVVSLQYALDRELEEEVTIMGGYSIETLDLCLCANENEVDRKHLGLVNIYHMTDSPEIYSNEDALETLGFIKIDELLQKTDLETWGVKICEYLKENV